MSTFLYDIVFAMRTAQEKTGLTGAQKRVLVLDTLVGAGLIRSDEREIAGAMIDTLVWAARNRNDIKRFAKKTARTFCC
jgi:hypothetical protein